MYGLFRKDTGLVSGVQRKFNKYLMLFLALIYPILSSFFSSIILMPIMFIAPLMALAGFNINLNSSEFINSPLIMLISFFGSMIFYFIIVKFIERRPISTMGFNFNKKAFSEYVVGFIIGILMIALSATIIYVTGNGEVKFVGLTASMIPSFIFVIFTWMIQGATEEIMMRGYTLPVFGKLINVPVGIFISSIYFSALHLGNSGVGTMPLINLTLFGLFAAFYALYSKSLWGICALHSSWNFAQGNLFGFSVSGTGTIGNILMESSYSSNNIINGGAFGPEGGLAVTLVLVVGILLILILQKKRTSSQNNY